MHIGMGYIIKQWLKGMWQYIKAKFGNVTIKELRFFTVLILYCFVLSLVIFYTTTFP